MLAGTYLMAEWAQLRRGQAPNPDLERGRWYEVESRTRDGMVRVLAPYAIHESKLRFINYEPRTITRVELSPLEQLAYQGVCPRGHRIDLLLANQLQAHCLDCHEMYPVEDEEPM